MVCRQMGFNSVNQYYWNSKFGPVAEDHAFTLVVCSGRESRLQDCFTDFGEPDSWCNKDHGIGVECSFDYEFTTTTSTTPWPNVQKHYRDTSEYNTRKLKSPHSKDSQIVKIFTVQSHLLILSLFVNFEFTLYWELNISNCIIIKHIYSVVEFTE